MNEWCFMPRFCTCKAILAGTTWANEMNCVVNHTPRQNMTDCLKAQYWAQKEETHMVDIYVCMEQTGKQSTTSEATMRCPIRGAISLQHLGGTMAPRLVYLELQRSKT